MTWLHGLEESPPKMRLAALKWSAMRSAKAWVYIPPKRSDCTGTYVKLPLPPMEWRYRP